MKLKRTLFSITASITLAGMMFVSSSVAAAVPSTAAAPSTFSPEQTKAIQHIVHDYLINKPEVLLQASMELRKKMQEKQKSDTMHAISANKKALFDNPADPMAGNPNGAVRLVEFFDYQCPHCKDMYKAVDALVKQNKNLKVIFKEWPIFGGSSLDAAKAAIAANKQGKYLQLHSALLATPNPLTKKKILNVAKKAGLNLTKLKQDMDNPEVMTQLKANFNLARTLSLVGTPAFIMTNADESKFEFIPGQTTEEDLQKLISQLS